ncbi:GntR family transcriptional regulator [Ketogulonicigenium vulgare]|uniref:Transcriptional regulator, GntR family protein n=2 Tax=Ketogulonicigenium vulgare TaxID=92945 RepID=F9YB60_KETVW|nr:GntR family transcriptional regulator [Ketogulonicigenium vulgare]ADO44089.1 transcriptional regulator [Ketogulonicigenium vulgare Y25]AEM42612.1 transcriptional regulator, GntR family protein [Ketogulonicigenium vulgare WSH-001]ALJ82637.1 GntR family transcriptional regulator [Ketogulonicigenium vulgare]ANW35392.1 GntR family transcriptional regulator [Ketogulonicigenium vulgare]
MMVRRPEGVKEIEEIYRTALEGLQIDFSRVMGPQIYDVMRKLVVQNSLAPGTPIYEAKFAEILGVSRTPLRAALQQMAKEGLIETRPQVGSIVAPVDPEKIVSAVFCRSALETAVVRRLAELPQFDPKPFRRILAAQEDFSSRDDYIGFFEVDEAFHAQLAETAGVPEAWRLILSNKTHVDRARLSLQSAIPGRAAVAYREHLDIMAALEKGEPELAAQYMDKHVRSALDII